jgi:hypothetical protein
MDNVFIERLWRSLKYAEVYLHAYASVAEATAGIGRRSGHIIPKALRRPLRRRQRRRGLQVRQDIMQRLPHRVSREGRCSALSDVQLDLQAVLPKAGPLRLQSTEFTGETDCWRGRGIRTLGPHNSNDGFRACPFNLSGTFPFREGPTVRSLSLR